MSAPHVHTHEAVTPAALHYLNEAREALLLQATRATDLAQKLQQAAAELGMSSGHATTLDRFCWAVNEIENHARNINYSNLARVAAELRT